MSADIAAAMKARDASRLSALRMLKAAIMNKSVEKGRDLDDAEILQVVASLVKRRDRSIEQFKAGRTDLVEKETGELAVLQPTCRRRRRRRRSMPPSPRPLPKPVPHRRKTSAR